MSIREKFIAELETWVGTPFVFEGGRKNVGSNCSQFVLHELIDTLGATAPEVTRFRQASHIKMIRKEPAAIPNALKTFCQKISKEQIQPGDIILISFAEIPAQIAVYKGDGVYIYSTKETGVVVQTMPANLLRRVVSVWRPKCYEEGD